jgi:hypothetical protein
MCSLAADVRVVEHVGHAGHAVNADFIHHAQELPPVCVPFVLPTNFPFILFHLSAFRVKRPYRTQSVTL